MRNRNRERHVADNQVTVAGTKTWGPRGCPQQEETVSGWTQWPRHKNGGDHLSLWWVLRFMLPLGSFVKDELNIVMPVCFWALYSVPLIFPPILLPVLCLDHCSFFLVIFIVICTHTSGGWSKWAWLQFIAALSVGYFQIKFIFRVYENS